MTVACLCTSTLWPHGIHMTFIIFSYVWAWGTGRGLRLDVICILLVISFSNVVCMFHMVFILLIIPGLEPLSVLQA